ncbi:MAG: hypothetical protein IKK21_00780 [Clostridia bacterium]|nr:hypothetical protein [Clostridia bacterium]
MRKRLTGFQLFILLMILLAALGIALLFGGASTRTALPRLWPGAGLIAHLPL